jgi:hypothetical protein
VLKGCAVSPLPVSPPGFSSKATWDDNKPVITFGLGLKQAGVCGGVQGGAGGDGAVPTDGLSFHMQSLWSLVVQNKDLDLPNHRTMVATVRCAEIAAALKAATLEGAGPLGFKPWRFRRR